MSENIETSIENASDEVQMKPNCNLCFVSVCIWEETDASAMMSEHAHTMFSTTIYNAGDHVLKQNVWLEKKIARLRFSAFRLNLQTVSLSYLLNCSSIICFHARKLSVIKICLTAIFFEETSHIFRAAIQKISLWLFLYSLTTTKWF